MSKELIRVAEVMGKMLGGGVEAVVMNYYGHVDRPRVQFDLLVGNDSTLVPQGEIESLGGCVFAIPPYQRQLVYQRELVGLFREYCWPIVYSRVNALSVVPLCAAAKAGVRVRIAHSHSTSGRGEHVKNAAKKVLRIFSNVYPTDRFACGRYAGEWLFGHGRSFTVVRNAVDLKQFALQCKDDATADRQDRLWRYMQTTLRSRGSFDDMVNLDLCCLLHSFMSQKALPQLLALRSFLIYERQAVQG